MSNVFLKAEGNRGTSPWYIRISREVSYRLYSLKLDIYEAKRKLTAERCVPLHKCWRSYKPKLIEKYLSFGEAWVKIYRLKDGRYMYSTAWGHSEPGYWDLEDLRFEAAATCRTKSLIDRQ